MLSPYEKTESLHLAILQSFFNHKFFSCSSEVHIIAMYEPEGSIRGFQEDPVNVPDVPVSTGIRVFHQMESIYVSR